MVPTVLSISPSRHGVAGSCRCELWKCTAALAGNGYCDIVIGRVLSALYEGGFETAMTAIRPPKAWSRRGMVLGVASILLAVAQLPWYLLTFMISYAFLGGDKGAAGIGIGGYVSAFGVLALPSVAGVILGAMVIPGSAVRPWKNPGLYGLTLNALWIVYLALGVATVYRN